MVLLVGEGHKLCRRKGERVVESEGSCEEDLGLEVEVELEVDMTKDLGKEQ